MNSNFKFASIISVLAILLWFVFYAFNTSLDTSKLSSEGIVFNPQEHTAKGFAAFEDRKALHRAEKNAKAEEKKKKPESNKKQGTPATSTTQSTRLTASGFLSQQAPQLSTLEQLQQDQASVAEQLRQLKAAQTLPAQTQTQVAQNQAAQQPNQVQQSQLSETKPTPASNNVQAIEAILSVENSTNCQDNYVAAVFFRENSASMRGKSLLSLDALIEEHRKCPNSVFLVKSTISDESTYMLNQRRRDEVKYYLLQRRVEKAAINLYQ